MRITARILDLRRTRQGPAFSELGALDDLAAMEVRLGWQALEQLRPKTAPPEEEFLKARPPVRLDAMESYVRGLLAASPEQRHRFFTQAARLDAHYSQPCFQLGKTFWEQKEYGIAAGWLDRVSRSDPHYLEAQFFLGLCRYYGGDFKGAEQAFQIVAASVPLNEVYNNLGAAQAQRNDSAAAGASFRKALEGDDADPDYHFNLGCVLWQSGQYAAAVESFRAAVERNPNDAEATVMLGRALKQEGPRPGDPRTQARERLKTNYEEAAYRQLQAELGRQIALRSARRPYFFFFALGHLLYGGGLDGVQLREILVEIGFALGRDARPGPASPHNRYRGPRPRSCPKPRFQTARIPGRPETRFCH